MSHRWIMQTDNKDAGFTSWGACWIPKTSRGVYLGPSSPPCQYQRVMIPILWIRNPRTIWKHIRFDESDWHLTGTHASSWLGAASFQNNLLPLWFDPIIASAPSWETGYIGTFLVAVIKYLIKRNLQKEGLFRLTSEGGLLSITAGKSQWQEQEAAGHMASTIRKHREMNASAQPAFSFIFSLELRPPGWSYLHSWCSFSPPLNLLDAHSQTHSEVFSHSGSKLHWVDNRD